MFCMGFVEKSMEADSWFTCWLNHLPGKPIYFPQRTPMEPVNVGFLALERKVELG